MNHAKQYQDRHDAGHVLAAHVMERLGAVDAVVLALPRGGVPVGLPVAHALQAPLDVFIVRKLGAPQQPELAIGAIAAGGFEVLNAPLIAQLGLTEMEIAAISDREVAELARREALYRADRPAADVHGRTVVIVDDGLATGFTMRAAIQALRDRLPARLVVAVPVGADQTCDELRAEVDEVICPLRPYHFDAVGAWYRDFRQTSDDEVRECLAAASPFEPVPHRKA